MTALSRETLQQLYDRDPIKQGEAMQALKVIAKKAGIRQDIVDDVVTEVALRLNPETVATIRKSPSGYVYKMLRYKAADFHRKEASKARTAEKARVAASLAPAQGDDAEDEEQAEQLFERARDALLADPGARDADELRQRFGEIRELSLKLVTMNQLVERSRRPDENPITVRDRIYQQHKRARDALLATLLQLERTGGLSDDESRLVRGYLRGKQRRAVRSSTDARLGGDTK